jgi:hypothetical protein
MRLARLSSWLMRDISSRTPPEVRCAICSSRRSSPADRSHTQIACSAPARMLASTEASRSTMLPTDCASPGPMPSASMTPATSAECSRSSSLICSRLASALPSSSTTPSSSASPSSSPIELRDLVSSVGVARRSGHAWMTSSALAANHAASAGSQYPIRRSGFIAPCTPQQSCDLFSDATERASQRLSVHGRHGFTGRGLSSP